MITQSTSVIGEQEGLSEDAVRRLSKAKNEPAWMLQQRLVAFKAFEELPMPQLSYGLHVNAPVNIAIHDLRPLENIARHKSSSAGDVIIEDLSVAAAKHESILRPLIAGNREYRNKLEALFAAFWNTGVFVYAPRQKQKGMATLVTLELPQRQTTLAAVVIVAEENSNLAVVESLTANETVTGSSRAYRIEGDGVIAAQNATVKFATLQKLGSHVNSLLMRRAGAGKDAVVYWADISIGGGSTRLETETILNGEGATSNITGAFFCDDAQQLDIMAKAVHNARSTASNMSIKGALKGRSKAIVQSFTKITKNAANSAGHQKANILLLSDSAKASPIPKLEIDNYDVKASHEASVGRLDSEKLFYMLSRGLEAKEAMRLVVEGFFEPLLRQMQSVQLAGELRQTITAKMEAVEKEGTAVAK